MKILYRIMAVLLLLVIAAPASMAQENGNLKLTSTFLRQVEIDDGKGGKRIDLVPVEKAVPGEELVVRVTYFNQGSEPAENIVIVNPVPDQMFYVAGSATGELVTTAFSIDGGKTFDLPGNLLITDESGKQVPAPPKTYTHIRFTRSRALPPGESDEVSFRAVLE